MNKIALAIAAVLVASAGSTTAMAKRVAIDDAADLYTQQQQEKSELQDMAEELSNLKTMIKDAEAAAADQQSMLNRRGNVREIQLTVKETAWEVLPETLAEGLGYNGQVPGPLLRVKQGDPVRVIVHNQMKTPTSLSFHGLKLPQAVAGLPRKDAGLIGPGQDFAYQFIADTAGTYWYHPQVTHLDQLSKGLFGAIVVESNGAERSYDRDVVLVLSRVRAERRANGKSGDYFLVNGKAAPAVPPIEVHMRERLRLRIINASGQACPVSLTGHRFVVASINGSDAGDAREPRITRDTFTLQPADRVDLDVVADNPGVWSLASMLPHQASNDGRFPGGIAIVVRYPEAMPR